MNKLNEKVPLFQLYAWHRPPVVNFEMKVDKTANQSSRLIKFNAERFSVS